MGFYPDRNLSRSRANRGPINRRLTQLGRTTISAVIGWSKLHDSMER